MRFCRAAFLLLAPLILPGPSYAMPFNILVDDPVTWGCPNLLITISTKHHGAELFIPDQHVAEAARIPWENHLESQVHVRTGNPDDVSPPIPIFVDALRTFHICPTLDREKLLGTALIELRTQAKREGKRLMRIVALASATIRRARFLMLDTVDLSDGDRAPRLIRAQVRSLFTQGVGLKLGESINVFMLAADSIDGLPPRSEEISLANDVFRSSLPCVAGDPHRYPGRHLVTLIKSSSVLRVPDLIFVYDPWENSRNFLGKVAP